MASYIFVLIFSLHEASLVVLLAMLAALEKLKESFLPHISFFCRQNIFLKYDWIFRYMSPSIREKKFALLSPAIQGEFHAYGQT